jgi:phage FluMu gp28-like protein
MSGGILLPYQRDYIADTERFKMWMASRQAGKSFAMTLEGALDCVEHKTLWVFLSAGERQARELSEKTKMHLEAISIAAEHLQEDYRENDGTTYNSLVTKLENGSRLIFLPANPSTARGYTANVVLDEFAFHDDSRAIWAALFPSITRRPDLKIRIASTPNGKSNKFYELWTSDSWSKHRTDIYDAVKAGLDVDPEELRKGLNDPEAWQQEYLLEFLEENTAYLTYEMLISAEDDTATIDAELEPDKAYYLGFDVGRHRDLSVIWVLEKVGDVYWTRKVVRLKNVPFAAQREILYGLMPYAQRLCIDATGLGEQMAEEAVTDWGYKVEPVKFTNASKADLALTLRRAYEDRLIRTPRNEHDIRESLHSVRRIVTPAGNVRFDAERDSKGHADEFWALALAVHAGSDGNYGHYVPNEVTVTSRSFAGERGRW